MKVGGVARGGLVGLFMKWAARLRFPYLFALTAVVFVFNLFMPDALPLVDEIIMGLIAALLASLRKPKDAETDGKADGKADGKTDGKTGGKTGSKTVGKPGG